MQRGNLKCNATNCMHNIDYDCKAGAIHVSGLGAVSVEGTSCTSFENSLAGSPKEKESFFNSSNNSFVNNTGDSTTKPCDIKCEAHNCIYNENKECHAEYVEIDEYNAYCGSFNYREHV